MIPGLPADETWLPSVYHLCLAGYRGLREEQPHAIRIGAARTRARDAAAHRRRGGATC